MGRQGRPRGSGYHDDCRIRAVLALMGSGLSRRRAILELYGHGQLRRLEGKIAARERFLRDLDEAVGARLVRLHRTVHADRAAVPEQGGWRADAAALGLALPLGPDGLLAGIGDWLA